MPQHLPGSVLTALAAVAATTFLAGMLLEQFALDYLQGHPYFVNLLSGATGFSTTALIAATLFNRAITEQRTRERDLLMERAVIEWRRPVHDATQLLVMPKRDALNDLPPQVLPPPEVNCLGLNDILRGQRPRHGLATSTPTCCWPPPELSFIAPEGKGKFLELARKLADEHAPEIVRVFEIEESFGLSSLMKGLKVAVEDGDVGQIVHLLCAFASFVRKHPRHVAYLGVAARRLPSRYLGDDLRYRTWWRRR